MKITRIGVDLAKRVFQIYGVDEHGTVRVSRALSRNKMLAYFAQLPSCLVGMEACGSAQAMGSCVSTMRRHLGV